MQLSQTMRNLLRSADPDGRIPCDSERTEITAQALISRGFAERTQTTRGVWAYRLTPKGRRWLADHEPDHPAQSSREITVALPDLRTEFACRYYPARENRVEMVPDGDEWLAEIQFDGGPLMVVDMDEAEKLAVALLAAVMHNR